MMTVRRGANAPARWRLLVCGLDCETTIELAAGDAWEVTVGPEGDLWSPLQLY
ncbi:hypothetical protein [Bradyrhizobium sp. Gha]|uniref:hypothetical protein n=1 Tax=Bradyrhizobium sp. Gha TaxID=1855318 RepID=UPI0008DEAF57|nr:hypothetical protein [Bradyrhizobium sp. Gha]SFJ13114.1 hypothetical protein SAMN05216525_11919 [Bradyrhizobium sp. Gha]